jgi:hypothetical protein
MTLVQLPMLELVVVLFQGELEFNMFLRVGAVMLLVQTMLKAMA